MFCGVPFQRENSIKVQMKSNGIRKTCVFYDFNRWFNVLSITYREMPYLENSVRKRNNECKEHSSGSEDSAAQSLEGYECGADVNPKQAELRYSVESDSIRGVKEDDSCQGDGECPYDEKDELERCGGNAKADYVQEEVEEHRQEHSSGCDSEVNDSSDIDGLCEGCLLQSALHGRRFPCEHGEVERDVQQRHEQEELCRRDVHVKGEGSRRLEEERAREYNLRNSEECGAR